MAKNDSLEELKALNDKIWTAYRVTRRLTGAERKLVHRAIVEHSLIVKLYTAGNQGVGMQLYAPEETMGVAPFPGVTYSMKDTTLVINLWEDHFFDDDPIKYRFRKWCEAHGTHQVDRAYKFFRAFADLPHNVMLMEHYNFPKPYIDPVSAFHY